MAIVKPEQAPEPVLAYSPEGAARALSLSRTRIYEMFASGELHPVKVGRRTLISAKELEAYADRLFGGDAA